MMDEWKRERNEQAAREYLRKTTDAAYMRMRQRTAKEQLADAIERGKGTEEVPDADDASAWRGKD